MDAFPDDPSEWIDTDGDGFGDNVDSDDDNDIVLDADDAFPLTPLSGLTQMTTESATMLT